MSANLDSLLVSLIDSLYEPVIVIDTNGAIICWNKGAERLYGYPAKQVIDRPLSMVRFPNEFNGLLNRLAGIATGEQIVQNEILKAHRDGADVYMEITLSGITTADGKVIGACAVARDRTELRKTQVDLNMSDSLLRGILEAAVDFGIIVIDEAGIIIDWNSGAEIMFGYSKKEALGLNAAIIFTPEDRYASIHKKEIIVAKTTGRSSDERWHLRKDGTRFFMSGVMTPLRSGNITGYVKIARNITDRKLAEEALFLSEQQKSLALQSAEMGEWEWNLEGGRIKISEQVTALLGLSPDIDQLAVWELLQQVYPDDQEMVRRQVNLAVEGLNIFHTECRIIRIDNQQVRWINLYGRVVGQLTGQVSKMVGVVYDITSRKTLEKQKDDFIGLASHELKTPVTAIKSISDMLIDEIGSSPESYAVDLLKKLNGQVDRLISLIRNVLDTSVINEGMMKLKPETIDLNRLVEENLEALQAVSSNHHLIWQPAQIPLIHADRERVMQVINNFISNAAKYASPGTHITLTIEDLSDKVKLSVKDEGPGIPENEQHFLFERYYRGDYNAQQKGFGLGLYICSEIIKQHHGFIGVQSRVGEGSTFYFTLPYT